MRYILFLLFFCTGILGQNSTDQDYVGKVLYELKHEGIAAINGLEPVAVGIFQVSLSSKFFGVQRDRKGRITNFRLRATYNIEDTK